MIMAKGAWVGLAVRVKVMRKMQRTIRTYPLALIGNIVLIC